MISSKEFIAKVEVRQPNKYDLSQLDYKGAKVKVKVVCSTHGIYLVRPDVLLKGNICPKCNKDNLYSDFNTVTFIAKSKEVHENKYDYSLTQYSTSTKEVVILCPIHGRFTQLPKSHIKGHGCSKCGTQRTADRKILSQDTVIKDFIKVHGSLYDYSKVNYIKDNEKVTIICKRHGEFTQQPTSHKQGSGCPICKCNAFKNKPTTLYYIKVEHKEFIGYKIGITTSTVRRRYKSDITQGTKITILDSKLFEDGQIAYEKEQYIVRSCKHLVHPHGEAILLGGATELFSTDILQGKLP